jgi:ABC-type Fe3+-hydroxamate transport system substrate-binding protein
LALDRRALLGAGIATVAGLRPAWTSAPPRIVCLEWTAAELVLALGITPIAVGDVAGYREWVVEPELPAATIDLGSRSEPNAEIVRRLRPDLVIATRGYGIDIATFASLAATFELVFFSGAAPPLTQGALELLRLGDRLGRADAARATIVQSEGAIDAAASRMAARRGERICIVSMFEERHLRIYGAGSLFAAVTDRLGLVNAWSAPTNAWGFSTISFDQLAKVGAARMVVLTPISRAAERMMKESGLWTSLPCVKAGPPLMIPAVWPYGGLTAAARFGRLLAERFAFA